MTRKIKAALVGVGLASAPHLKSLCELSELCQVKWVAARSEKRLDSVRKMLPDARFTTDLDQVLADPELDCVLLLTPPNTHLELGAKFAAAGKHVLVEKPLDISLPRSIELVEVCKANKVKLAVMLQHRCRESVVHLKSLIDQQELGELLSCAVTVRWWRDNTYYAEPGRGSYARDGGGVLMTQAIHTLDLLLFLVGQPSEIFSYMTTTKAHRIEAEDLATATLRFENKMLGTVHVTTAAPPGFPETIEISGIKGSVVLRAGELMVSHVDGREKVFGQSQSYGAGKDPMAFDHLSHKKVIEGFFKSILENTDNFVSGESALAVHRLISRMNDSARLGMPVSLE